MRHQKFVTKCYRKPSSKNILVNHKSAHSAYHKQNILKNLERTTLNLSTTPIYKKESLKLMESVSRGNGYDALPHCSNEAYEAKWNKGYVLFRTPFISETFNHVMKRLITSCDLPINLVLLSPSNLKQRMVSSCIYEKSCRT